MTRKIVECELVKHWALCLVAAGASLVAGGIAIQQGFRIGNDAMIIAVMNKLSTDEL